ncbi:helix-turn-helix domain-containing protein [Candidatus Methanoperedens nitratireducens]|uniref:Uncharacterized protein n=1 Tax=Candidatus Methanoperedens nitratireducens TaxID=1392998 RepID=A0A284VK89_9EURY|nr:helix-turn-helix domain-containing protein [Candidatus Methanoperedens nitroreducens]SNQ59670.1 hypothetical protein MNV_1260018 [Candidatus Methanoperedens nitroreducens]
MESEENDQGNGQGNSREMPDIVRILAKRPEMRRELISWVKKEFGFNIESYLEEYFDELPDKKYKIEELAMPLREIAENVLGMTDDGYSPSQIAADLGIYRSQVSKILKDRGRWEKEIAGAVRKQVTQNKKLPWYVRLAAKLKLI